MTEKAESEITFKISRERAKRILIKTGIVISSFILLVMCNGIIEEYVIDENFTSYSDPLAYLFIFLEIFIVFEWYCWIRNPINKFLKKHWAKNNKSGKKQIKKLFGQSTVDFINGINGE